MDLSATAADDELAPVRERAVDSGRAVLAAARAGEARAALDGARRLPRAVRAPARRARRGGVDRARARPGWRAPPTASTPTAAGTSGGRCSSTANDYGLRLYNGDTGVVVASAAGPAVAAFERAGEVLEVSPSRLEAVDTVYAMTVHKSQGSQFEAAAVLLPPPASPILTRELLYTAVTRAREQLILAGTEATIRAAVGRPVARASGLRERLWGE